jgi:predicted protein tyrosine phosphatase
MTTKQTHILFVCSKNQWRSPTAEQIWCKHSDLKVRSGGTSSNARHTVSIDDIKWAHIIFVMEEKHKVQLKAKFPSILENKKIYVLDIPDEYKYMDPELIDLLQQSVSGLLHL